MGQFSRWQNLQGRSSNVVYFGGPDASHRISVTVSVLSTSSGLGLTRSATSTVVVDTRAKEVPSVLRLDWNADLDGAPKKMTMHSDVTLVASVGFTQAVRVSWVIEPKVEGLQAASKTALSFTQSAPVNNTVSEIDVFLKFPGSVLAPRTEYVLTLTLTLIPTLVLIVILTLSLSVNLILLGTPLSLRLNISMTRRTFHRVGT